MNSPLNVGTLKVGIDMETPLDELVRHIVRDEIKRWERSTAAGLTDDWPTAKPARADVSVSGTRDSRRAAQFREIEAKIEQSHKELLKGSRQLAIELARFKKKHRDRILNLDQPVLNVDDSLVDRSDLTVKVGNLRIDIRHDDPSSVRAGAGTPADKPTVEDEPGAVQTDSDRAAPGGGAA